MFERKKSTSIDVNRIASAAVDALLGSEEQSPNGTVQKQRNGLGTIPAVAMGAALAVAARALYSRARKMDLAQVAESVEEPLGN
jgi:hypothetical protein